jgi:hypothetical protein
MTGLTIAGKITLGYHWNLTYLSTPTNVDATSHARKQRRHDDSIVGLGQLACLLNGKQFSQCTRSLKSPKSKTKVAHHYKAPVPSETH